MTDTPGEVTVTTNPISIEPDEYHRLLTYKKVLDHLITQVQTNDSDFNDRRADKVYASFEEIGTVPADIAGCLVVDSMIWLYADEDIDAVMALFKEP